MNPDEFRTRMTVYDFARRSFRDVADRDYVLARVAFRHNLNIQFLYLAHEAVEKYLKGILLFNLVSTKSLNHDLSAALDKVRTALPFRVRIPSDVSEFIRRLGLSYSRYFEYSYAVSGRTLYALDKAVWHIRRYCSDWRRLERRDDGTYSETLEIPLARIESTEYKRAPHRFRLPFGVLEDIVHEDGSELKAGLVWNNKYFGDGIADPDPDLGGEAANSAIILNRGAFHELDKLVRFSSQFRQLFVAKKKRSK